ncbi:MAG: DUF1329 domain-containing protein [Desulfobacteraceae bacterium]|nr:DUF1329 domain-containing protein [Desulfobacteraceae bacterium]
MKTLKNMMALALCSALLFSASFASAKVSKEEADRLKTDLTPIGAERAGNADGTIPAWEGGIPTPPPGLTTEKGPSPKNPYPDDKVKFSINKANMGQYADQLSEGAKWLLNKYPDTFRMDVYPTRRSAAQPQWIYDNAYQNALNASSTEDRLGILDAHGGTPFPIPQNAEQIVFNGILSWAGMSRDSESATYIVNADGSLTSTSHVNSLENCPYFFPEKPAPGQYADLWNMFMINLGPPRVAGNMTLIKDSTNPQEIPRRAWSYTAGQRRVRMAPTLSYDNPNGTSSLGVYDDLWMFSGALDRFDWKIIGKKEIYVPYNTNVIHDTTPPEEFARPGHFNPDYVRWELHRLWIVEATLKDGKRHVYGKRVFYYDEDTWLLVMKDQYDNRGEFWRFTIGCVWQDYTLPGAIHTPWLSFDVTLPYWQLEAYYYGDQYYLICNEKKILPADVFTPDYLRKMGRR